MYWCFNIVRINYLVDKMVMKAESLSGIRTRIINFLPILITNPNSAWRSNKPLQGTKRWDHLPHSTCHNDENNLRTLACSSEAPVKMCVTPSIKQLLCSKIIRIYSHNNTDLLKITSWEAGNESRERNNSVAITWHQPTNSLQ